MLLRTTHLVNALLAMPLLFALQHSAAAEERLAATTEDSLETHAAAAAPVDSRPVTQDQFNQLLRSYKSALDRIGKMEANINSSSATGGKEEAIDLNSATAVTANASGAPVGASKNFHGQSSGFAPDFKIYFDLDFVSRPGVENLSFDNYHSFLFFEVSPLPTLQFSFDVNPTPRYYELDYQATRWLLLRAGKIWIPFDDMSPHNIFGGRVNVSRLTAESNAPAFLPDLWTDLGVGLRINLVDKLNFALVLDGYVVNGFHDGGSDPVTPGSPYPNFADLQTGPDNNRDKALGGRIHTLIYRTLGLGVSYYNCAWNSDTGSTTANGFISRRLSIVGFDLQLRFKSTEFRAGLASMAVNLPTGDVANRGGTYIELGQRFGPDYAWKLLGRVGKTQLDDRVTDTNPAVSLGDEEIVGGTLLWKPGLVQYSLEYNQDLEQSPAKVSHSYAAARIVMAF